MFGKLVHGHDVLKKIENVGDEDGRPSVTVKIVNCGVLGGKIDIILMIVVCIKLS